MHRPLLVILALTLFTTTSDAGEACVQACRKVASCNLLPYNRCLSICTDGTPRERQETFAQARMSCSALAAQMAPTQWLCIAEGASSSGYDMDGYTPDIQNTRDIYMPAQGRTREAAATLALRNCGAIMGFQLEVGRSGSRESAITSGCHITRCIAPASARNRRQR